MHFDNAVILARQHMLGHACLVSTESIGDGAIPTCFLLPPEILVAFPARGIAIDLLPFRIYIAKVELAIDYIDIGFTQTYDFFEPFIYFLEFPLRLLEFGDVMKIYNDASDSGIIKMITRFRIQGMPGGVGVQRPYLHPHERFGVLDYIGEIFPYHRDIIGVNILEQVLPQHALRLKTPHLLKIRAEVDYIALAPQYDGNVRCGLDQGAEPFLAAPQHFIYLHALSHNSFKLGRPPAQTIQFVDKMFPVHALVFHGAYLQVRSYNSMCKRASIARKNVSEWE
jgi:hypothetical protein